MCILTAHGMPVFPVVFFIAPINADLYGAIGAALGSVMMLVKSWKTF